MRRDGGELRGLAELRQIRVRRLAGDGVAVISGNRASLHRLFLVLLDNALKYSCPGSDVMVAIAHEGGRVAVTVEDFGVGIAGKPTSRISSSGSIEPTKRALTGASDWDSRWRRKHRPRARRPTIDVEQEY